MLDVSSHWMMMTQSLMNNHHHKDTKDLSFILKIYYGNKLVLFLLCLGSEVLLIKFKDVFD